MADILIADDHGLVRDTIAAYLAQQPDFVVQTTGSLQGALAALDKPRGFDLVILDYKMPGMGGLEGMRRAIRRHPGVRFALMSGQATNDVARDAMSYGAAGYFPKSLSASAMVSAVRLVLAGEQYFPFSGVVPSPTADGPESYRGLSRREIDTLRLLCQGKSNKEIALDLELQEVTVKLHVKNILAKLGVKNRTQAALAAQEDGFGSN